MIKTSVLKELRRSSLITWLRLRKSVIRYCKAEPSLFAVFFSVSIFFHEYHDSQDSREVKALYIFISLSISLYSREVKALYIFISLSISLYTLSLYISLYLFLPLPPAFRHLDISQVIAAENSPLNMAGSRTRAGSLWSSSSSH